MTKSRGVGWMPVPFRDLASDEGLGLAGYLCFADEPDGKGLRGALFLVGARGEPVDFSFTRVDLPTAFLWRPAQARQQSIAGLVKALFVACPKEPAILLSLAADVSPRTFTEDIQVLIPICRIANDESRPLATSESLELLDGAIHLFWVGEPPAPDSAARRLLDALHGRNLLTEPFDRAALGITEAYTQ